MGFSSVLGQPGALARIKSAVDCGRTPPAWLFFGPAGTGKMLAAVETAKALLCENAIAKTADGSCGECPACLRVPKGAHPDAVIVNRDFQAQLRDEDAGEQKHLRVDTVRRALEMAQQKSVSGGWKVFIIDGAETMQEAAQNALLKLLEEPPPQMLWILLAVKREDMRPTIVSRCQPVRFMPLADDVFAEILVQQGCAMDEAQRLAAVSEGSVSRAMKVRELLEDLSGLDPLDPLYPFRAASSLPKELHLARQDAALIIELLINSAAAAWRARPPSRAKDELKGVITRLFTHRDYINRNVSPQLTLEAALLEAARLQIPVFSTR
ncbi:MAG: DNA polymerase III subunit delta' [Elusimicrobiales bacterium]